MATAFTSIDNDGKEGKKMTSVNLMELPFNDCKLVITEEIMMRRSVFGRTIRDYITDIQFAENNDDITNAISKLCEAISREVSADKKKPVPNRKFTKEFVSAVVKDGEEVAKMLQ